MDQYSITLSLHDLSSTRHAVKYPFRFLWKHPIVLLQDHFNHSNKLHNLRIYSYTYGTDLNAVLRQVGAEREEFSLVHVWVMGVVERFLQLVLLTLGEDRPAEHARVYRRLVKTFA